MMRLCAVRVWLRSEDAKVMARLIAGIHGDRNLERTYLRGSSSPGDECDCDWLKKPLPVAKIETRH